MWHSGPWHVWNKLLLLFRMSCSFSIVCQLNFSVFSLDVALVGAGPVICCVILTSLCFPHRPRPSTISISCQQVCYHCHTGGFSSGMFKCYLSHKMNIFQRMMHVCVCKREKLYTSSISSILIMWCVYLEAGRRSAMWFVDVHSYKLPSPSSVFMEHLWHKDSTWGAEHTKKACTLFKVLDQTQTHTSTLWLHLHKTSVATKKAEGVIHTDSYPHKKSTPH